MRTALLSLMLLAAVMISGAGIYAATASGSHQTTDGYGVSRLSR